MKRISVDTGREIARVRTVKSRGAHRIVLYENWLALEPGKKGVPVKGCEISVGRPGAGVQVAAAILAGAPTFMRQCIRVSGGGYSLTAYCYGRDRQEVFDFVQAVQAQAAS